jgi:hypothetical protein
MGRAVSRLGKDVAMANRGHAMNRKLKLLRDIKRMTSTISSKSQRTEEEVKDDERKLRFILTWVMELEEHEQAMIKALAPYLPEEE